MECAHGFIFIFYLLFIIYYYFLFFILGLWNARMV